MLFHRHVDDVHRFVHRRTGDAALADDLTAITFERCWAALPGLRPRHDSLRPFLFRIAANELASHFRSDRRRRAREHLVAVRDRATGQDLAFEGDDPALRAALAALDERAQMVLSLRFLADLSTEEVAAALGVGRRHLAVLQFRALRALRNVLEEERDG